MIIYWGMLVLNVLIQAAGNGSTVLILGFYILSAFLILGISALTPLVALSNPISLVLFVLFFLTVLGPIMVDAAGFFLMGTFLVLITALSFDSVYMLIVHPDEVIGTYLDVFENGLTSNVLQEWEDTVESYFGSAFVHIFGTRTLRDILDHFGLHLGLQAGVVLPLAIVLTLAKLLAMIGGVVMFIFGFIYLMQGADFAMALVFGGLAIMGYFIIFDGGLGTIADYTILSQLNIFYYEEDLILLMIADVSLRSLFHSFLTVESDYWGVYTLSRLIENWVTGAYTSDPVKNEYKLPEVG
mmetsp:Transcript_16959/g.26121  ORF Transcript_16959/g.26121 Transcript_16959/m.26121 type:complete len:298 (+) Transcript_16959:264-1157(+)|eukprot:CAMPEP_0170496118 /NCGR_PEP_ID=MMETSP0208-20121228/20229_1 /TAXON_ID=197538 /ORGANISM="Strombidium inclinatum, Strain S3" /LENGTH=297 /DNA_ID=CAMNT_0010772571 /DNA_START=254 /DNA_END=1147 /DNA_ORIENTATION=+